MSDITIEFSPNGPIIVKGQIHLTDNKGDKIQCGNFAALCRCGKSKKKPLCDGAHTAAGFTDKRVKEPGARLNYKGDKIEIHYNKELCTHAAECVSNLPMVFDPKRKPWIDPNQADSDQLKAIIRKCPSGSLSFTERGTETRDFDLKQEKIRIAKDGPYYITGSIPVASTPFKDTASTEHYALCRCGESRNKPFCDGYHHDIKFEAE